MCKSISPAVFLALVFKKRRSHSIAYSDLEVYREKMARIKLESTDGYDVDWNHDSFLFTLGFYAPVFQDDGANMRCNLKELDKYFRIITSSIPQEDISQLEFAFDSTESNS